jgi:hypothetical protein
MAIRDKVQEEIEKIAAEAKRSIQFVMESERGINAKTGTNTLVDSDIYNQIGIDIDNIELINILVNGYIDYIESGRKPGTWVPIQVLIEWAGKKGLPTSNKFIYSVQRSIFNEGINPRPIMDKVFELWDEYWDKEWADNIFNALTSELDELFNN